jgi:glycosyltransferase involved in cell wall biosynthesis
MDQHFKIITPVYNCEKWVGKCIKSTKDQVYNNFEHIIVDDGSTDNTIQKALKEIGDDTRFKIVKKEHRMGVMHSHVTGTELLGKDANSEDVFVHLDGDDWLAHNNVLKKVNQIYNEQNCWMTYGNYEATDKSPSVCASRNKDLMIRIHILQGGWPFSHLRTFKKFLWDKIKVESLLDSNGKMFTSACDVAILCPMLEMAGNKVYYIEEVLYVYNRENPLNEDKDHLEDQVRCALEIVQQTPYEVISR